MSRPICNGCSDMVYCARYGQKGTAYPGRPEILQQPHSRCGALATYIPMVMSDKDQWLASEIPAGGCPKFPVQENARA